VAATVPPARDLQLERKEEHAAKLGPRYHGPAGADVAVGFNVYFGAGTGGPYHFAPGLVVGFQSGACSQSGSQVPSLSFGSDCGGSG